MSRIDIRHVAAAGVPGKTFLKSIRTIGFVSLAAMFLSACAFSHVRGTLEQGEQVGSDSMLLAFSVAGGKLLRPHEILIEVRGRKGNLHQERLRIDEDPADGTAGIFVFSVPRQPLTLKAIVLISASGRTHWITEETGPELEAAVSGGIYLGRLNLHTIRFLHYGDGPEKRPDAMKIEFSDASAQDFPRLTKWQAIAADAQLAKREPGRWGREDFVGLRVMPGSRDEIHKDHRMESIFCLPKIEDFDEPCLD
jgi:hypothetical protein